MGKQVLFFNFYFFILDSFFYHSHCFLLLRSIGLSIGDKKSAVYRRSFAVFTLATGYFHRAAMPMAIIKDLILSVIASISTITLMMVKIIKV